MALFEMDSEHKFFLIVDQPLDELTFKRHCYIHHDPRHKPRYTVRSGHIELHCPIDHVFPCSVFLVPRATAAPAMVTVHDAIAEHYPELIFPSWKGRLFWKIKMISRF